MSSHSIVNGETNSKHATLHLCEQKQYRAVNGSSETWLSGLGMILVYVFILVLFGLKKENDWCCVLVHLFASLTD